VRGGSRSTKSIWRDFPINIHEAKSPETIKKLLKRPFPE